MAETTFASGYAFTGNPICFTDGSTKASARGFDVYVGGKAVYHGRYTPPATIDAAEIIDIFTPGIPDPGEDGTNWWSQIEGPVETKARRAYVRDENGDDLIGTFTAMRGGVSAQNLRALAATGKDIFATRLLTSVGKNFFLTARTHSWMITMKETELYPLCFIVDRDDTRLEIDAMGHTYRMNPSTGIAALDLTALRKKFWNDHRCIPSVFEVYDDRDFRCRIIIEEAMPSKERRMVKFRNSLGVFEAMELTGAATISDTYGTDGDMEAMAFDTEARTFARLPLPGERKSTMTINSGSKRSDELAFLGDMLRSEETYLKRDGAWERVILSVENATRKERQREPESIDIKVSFLDAEPHSTPEIGESTEFERGRIFTDHFTEEFN